MVGYFGAVGEYTNAGAEGDNVGGLGSLGGVGNTSRLFLFRRCAFLREYIRCISCFLVSKIEGDVGGGMAGAESGILGIAGVRAFMGVLAFFAFLARLRS